MIETTDDDAYPPCARPRRAAHREDL